MAYLIWRYQIPPAEALARVQLARAISEPNHGFMEQLDLFHEMMAPEDLEGCPKYQRWMYQREIALSNACGLAPDVDKIRFEDEHAPETSDSESELKCRKCRSVTSNSSSSLSKPSQSFNAFVVPAPQRVAYSCTGAYSRHLPFSWITKCPQTQRRQ